MNYFIYALVNPIDDTVFYVGCTIHEDLNKRLDQHIGSRYTTINKALGNKIKEIVQQGYRPTIKLLEASNSRQREGELINEHNKVCSLVNIIKKGAQGIGRKRALDHRIQVSVYLRQSQIDAVGGLEDARQIALEAVQKEAKKKTK